MDHCDLLHSDHSALTRETWMPTTKAEMSPFIGVIVQRKNLRIESIDHESKTAQSSAKRDSHLALMPYLGHTDIPETVRGSGGSNLNHQLISTGLTSSPDAILNPLLNLDSSSSESSVVQTTSQPDINRASMDNNADDGKAVKGDISRAIVPYDKALGKAPHPNSGEENCIRPILDGGIPHDTADESWAGICVRRENSIQDSRNDIERQPSLSNSKERALTAFVKIPQDAKLQLLESPIIDSRQAELQVAQLASQGILVNDPVAILPKRVPEIFYLPIKENTEVKQGPKKKAAEDIAGSVKAKTPPNIELRIPPFLTWATERPLQGLRGTDTPAPSTQESLDRVLTWMDHLMRQRGKGRPAKMYSRALEVTLEELENTRASLDSHNPSETDAKYQPVQASVSPESLAPKSSNIESFDSIRAHQLSEKDRLVDMIFLLGKELMSFFVPLSNQHCLTKKYWGAIHIIHTVIAKAADESKSITTQESNLSDKKLSNKNEFWVIRDISDKELLLKNYSIAAPSRGISDCHLCSSGTKYYFFDDGIIHLRKAHFRRPEEECGSDELPINALTNWLRNDPQLRYDQKFDQLLLMLSRLVEHLQALRANSGKIREGISTSESSVSSRYKLPSSLVKSFEQTITLLLWSAQSINLIDKHFRNWNYVPPNVQSYESEELMAASDRLNALVIEAQASMERAENDFILMCRTENDVETVSYIAVGLEYILASAIVNLCKRPIHRGLDVAELYQAFGRTLQLQATKHPRKRLIREIHRVIEEIELLRDITNCQFEVLWSFIQVLDDKSFRITNRTRNSRFHLEKQFLTTAHRHLKKKSADLDHLRSRMVNLSRQVAQSVEILEEDHGKAILLFTMVTIIFLPLSFVTGYLGMNTTDIRNSQQNQWIFWAISLPLTSLIVVLALLVALKGDSIREMWIDRQSFKEKKLERSLLDWRQSTLPDDRIFMDEGKREIEELFSQDGNGVMGMAV